MKKLSLNWTSILAILLIVALMGLAFWGKLTTAAIEYLSAVSEEAMSSLLLVTELKIAAASASSSKVPLISGSFQEVNSMLDKAFNYLEWTNILIALQLLLLSLSKSVVLKGVLLISIVFVFLKRSHRFALRLLIIFLLISPGLPIYVLSIKYVVSEVQIDLGGDLKAELDKAQTEYKAKEKAQQEKMDQKQQRQLAKAEAKGKKKISLFNRIEDGVEKTATKVADDVSLVFKESLSVLKSAGKRVIELCINLLSTCILLFFVLPIVYFWLMKNLCLHFFFNSFNPASAETTTPTTTPTKTTNPTQNES